MFSVVIPLYNKELSIKNTIQSVLDQSFQDFEIIVVNDGSTDGSVAAVKQIKDSRIKVINKVNGGVSTARNRGIEEAKGEWIAFLDGDDIWFSNHLQVIDEMINQFPSAELFATSYNYSDDRKVPRIFRENRFTIIDHYFKDNLSEHLIWTSIFTARKSCFITYRFPENLALGEDMVLWGLLVKDFCLVKANDITAIYRVDSENRSNVGPYKMEKSFLSSLDFSNMLSDEKVYYRKLIITKIKAFLVQKDWKNIFYLLLRYNINLIW